MQAGGGVTPLNWGSVASNTSITSTSITHTHTKAYWTSILSASMLAQTNTQAQSRAHRHTEHRCAHAWADIQTHTNTSMQPHMTADTRRGTQARIKTRPLAATQRHAQSQSVTADLYADLPRMLRFFTTRRQISAENATAAIPQELTTAWQEAVKSGSKAAKNQLFSLWCAAGGDWGQFLRRTQMVMCFDDPSAKKE